MKTHYADLFDDAPEWRARIEALASASISRTAPRSLSKMSSSRAGSNSDVVGRLLITRVFGKSAVTRLDGNGL